MRILEKPGLIERFVELIPLRYPFAALAWTIILGPLGFRIANYVQSSATPLQSPNPINEILGILLLYYLFYIVRYLRLKVVNTEHLITPIVSGGEKEYQSFFGRISSIPPIILMGIIFDVLATLNDKTLGFNALTISGAIVRAIILLAFSAFLWEYAVSSWGLHKLGQSPLKLKSFLEDRFMGAKSIGSLELSLTLAYFGGVLVFFLDTATFLPVFTNPGFEIFFLILPALGVVLFFLPLNSVHKRMQMEKAARQGELSRQLLTIKEASGHSGDGPASIESLGKEIRELVQLKEIEIAERKLASTPSWPFDIQLLAKVITIVLSVTAVLLSRIIVDYLKI
jgi:hypothetical protein